MKIVFGKLFVLVALLGLCSSMMAQVQSNVAEKVAPFAVERHSLKKSEKGFAYNVEIDFPVSGNGATVRIIREWIAEAQPYCYDGDVNDVRALMAYEYQKERKGWSSEDNYEMSLQFLKAYENDKFVTYTRYANGYSGGAHGYSSMHGATFRLSDGRRFGWDIFYSTRRLNAIIFDALKEQYFEVESDEEMSQSIDGYKREGNRQLPLPATEPWITDKGVVFYYQEYEIGAYCIGAPHCVVPFEKIKEWMYPSSLNLITQ